ncbi:MAG: hypothetical protein KC503_28595 [Myxococcales bacterium]|nr:hypothetical protein [Myxococcales bacterium]
MRTLILLFAAAAMIPTGLTACSDSDPVAPDTNKPAEAGLDAPGSDAPGSDAPGSDAPGSDAPGSDAPGSDAGDLAIGDGGGNAMSFFVSSVGLGKGGDLGGLAGADAHCKTLASAAGSTKTQWFAYLSAENTGGAAVHARDRIGTGPWYNVKGQMLAANLTALHPTIDPAVDRPGYIAVKPKDEVLYWDEKGQRVPGGEHDILTGSTAGGMVMAGATCSDWTSSAGGGGAKAQVGHSDTPSSTQFSPSWNSAHDTVSCSQSGVAQRGGSGRIYCFARD